MSRSPTRLGSPAFGWIASGRPPATSTICSSTPYKVLEPTEQFAPRAWTPNARRVRATSAGERPVNVTPSSVKAISAAMGRSVTERIASMASAISARSEHVSTMKASTPPSRSPSACSRNAARESSAVTLPRDALYLPSGPTDPRIRPSRPCDMRAPERDQAAGNDLVGAEPARVDHDVRASVVGLARAVERPELLGAPAREHRPVSRPARALAEVGEVAREPHDGAERAEGLHAPLAAGKATTRRDDVARFQLERLQRLGFDRAEALLALRADDLGDRARLAGDDHVVGLHEAAPEPAR